MKVDLNMLVKLGLLESESSNRLMVPTDLGTVYHLLTYYQTKKLHKDEYCLFRRAVDELIMTSNKYTGPIQLLLTIKKSGPEDIYFLSVEIEEIISCSLRNDLRAQKLGIANIDKGDGK